MTEEEKTIWKEEGFDNLSDLELEHLCRTFYHGTHPVWCYDFNKCPINLRIGCPFQNLIERRNNA